MRVEIENRVDLASRQGDSKMGKPACMKQSVQSESTYNRKQRNLACSDSDFLGLIGEDESRGVEGVARNTQEK